MRNPPRPSPTSSVDKRVQLFKEITLALMGRRQNKAGVSSFNLRHAFRAWVLCLTSFSMVACGGGGGGDSTPPPPPAPSPTGSTGSPPSAPGPLTMAPVPTPRSEAHLKDTLALASKAKIVGVSDPTLPVHMDFTTKLMGYSVTLNASTINTAFTAAKTAWTKEAGKTVGNPTQLTLLAITTTRDELKGVIGGRLAGLVAMAVQQDLLGASNDSAGRGLLISEDELGNKRRAAVLQEAGLRCTVDSNTASLCNTLFKTRLGGVDVNSAFSQVCASSTETYCAVLANPPATAAAREAHVTTVLRKVTAAAQACGAGDSSCKTPTAKEQKAEQTKQREEEAKKIEAAGDNLAKYGQQYLGLSADDAAATQAFFTTGSKLYKNVYAAASAYDTLKNVDLKQALTLNSLLRGVIFEDTSNPKWVQGINLVEGIGGAIAAVSGVVGAVMGIVKIFGGKKASSAEQQQAQQLLQALDAMRKQLSSQIAAIDAKLDSVLLLSSDILAAVFASNNSLSQQQAAAQRGLAQLNEAVSTLSYEAQGWAQDGAADYFNGITGTEYPLTDYSLWKTQATSVKSWLINTAPNSTHAGPEGTIGDLNTELARPGGAWINALRQAPKLFGLQVLSSPRVPSPSDTIGVSIRFWLPLLTPQHYRSFLEQSSGDIKRYVTDVLEDNIVPLEVLRREIQLNTDLLPALGRAYANAAKDLATKQDQAVITWMSTAGTSGSRDVSAINPWAGGAQALTGYVPRTLATGAMPHCEGPAYGSPLSLPDWKKVVPAADPALTTDALGGTTLSICYRLTGTLAGGWTHYVWERVNDDHKQAMGAFTVQVVVKLGSKVVATRTVRAPASGDVCFADVPKSQVDTISSNRPAISVLAQAWDGSYGGGGVCNQAAIPSIANVREAFNASTEQSVSWVTSDPAARADTLASNERAVASLAVGVENYLADQITLNGVAVADAARPLSGLKLALRRYIEFGYPSLWRTNDAVRAAFEGTAQIVDAAEVQRLLRAAAVTASGTTRPAKFAFSPDAITRMDSLVALVTAYQAKVVSGALVDNDVELMAVRAQLEAILGSLE